MIVFVGTSSSFYANNHDIVFQGWSSDIALCDAAINLGQGKVILEDLPVISLLIILVLVCFICYYGVLLPWEKYINKKNIWFGLQSLLCNDLWI